MRTITALAVSLLFCSAAFAGDKIYYKPMHYQPHIKTAIGAGFYPDPVNHLYCNTSGFYYAPWAEPFAWELQEIVFTVEKAPEKDISEAESKIKRGITINLGGKSDRKKGESNESPVAVDPYTGKIYQKTPGGIINPDDSLTMPKVGKDTYFDISTGEFKTAY